MQTKKDRSQQTSSEKRRRLDPFYAGAAIVVLIIIILFFVWQQQQFSTALSNGNHHGDSQTEETEPSEANSHDTATSSQAEGERVMPVDSPAPPPSISKKNALAEGQDSQSVTEVGPNEDSASLSPLNPENGTSEKTGAAGCDKHCTSVKAFYAHLDMQDYIKAYHLPSNSETYFTQLIQRLLDNPPVVSGELNDLFTILQNTAHFFRILGKDNITLLKAILDGEKDQFESVLQNYYILVQNPECAKQNFSLTIPPKALYEYAGFFLDSMGGRLYLFRRDSKSRMIVSYYAILLIDKANDQGANEHGISLKPHIEQLIEEMESTNNSLTLLDTYLDTLYSLKAKYH